jgi:hypothetical protein
MLSVINHPPKTVIDLTYSPWALDQISGAGDVVEVGRNVGREIVSHIEGIGLVGAFIVASELAEQAGDNFNNDEGQILEYLHAALSGIDDEIWARDQTGDTQ